MCDRRARRFLGILTFFALTAGAGIGHAQYLACGAVGVAPDSLFVKSVAPPYESEFDYADVNCFLHVLRESDGSGGLGAVEIDSLLIAAADDLVSIGITLLIAGQSDLANSTYYADPISCAAQLFATNAHTDAIDIYIGPSIGPAAGQVSGIPGSALLLTGAFGSGSALSHLLGHCLGLYETNETVFGVETPDGSNGTTAGDLVADTNADPGLTGWVDGDCTLSAGFTTNFPYYDPDPTNIMSNGRISCWSTFTELQRARTLAAIESFAVLKAVVEVRDQQYVDATATTLLRTFDTLPSLPTNAVAFDYNGDGTKDVLIAGHSAVTVAPNRGCAGRCSGYAAHGIPVFVDGTTDAFGEARPPNGTLGLIAADYDNDGFVDFYAPNARYDEVGSNPGFPHRLYRGTGSGFQDVTSDVGLSILPYNEDATLSGAWGDYDSDGYLDLLTLVAQTSMPPNTETSAQYLRLYRNVPVTGVPGGRGYSEVTASAGIGSDDCHVNSTLWIDFDQDHDMDLITIQWSQESQERSTYYRNTDGHLTDITSTHFSEVAYFTDGHFFAAPGDLDNDGDVDVAYHGIHYKGWLRNNFNGSPESASVGIAWSEHQDSAFAEGWPTDPRDLDVFDFDLDGHLDMAVPNRVTPHPHRLLRNSPDDESFEHVVGPGLGNADARGIGAASYATDGFTELLIATHRTNQPLFCKAKAAVDETATNHWVGIRLEAAAGSCNYRGIGATVIVTAGSFQQAQVVDGGSGRAGQHDLDLSFGVGTYWGPVDVEVI